MDARVKPAHDARDCRDASIHPGKLHRSRGANAPEGCSPVIPGGGVDPRLRGGKPPQKARGTARRDARPVRLCTPSCEGVAPLGAPSRLSPRDLAPRSSAPGRASWDVALAAVSRLRPVPAQRAPRSPVVVPDGRSPGAARVRGERSHARERRALTPRAGATGSCPSGGSGGEEFGPRVWRNFLLAAPSLCGRLPRHAIGLAQK